MTSLSGFIAKHFRAVTREQLIISRSILESCRAIVEKAKMNKILENNEIRAIISAIGAGLGAEFNEKDSRYGKVILMTDADVDGSHIRTLLLTFFYRQMNELVARGHLFIAQPPLYKVKRGSKETYLKHEAALETFVIEAALDYNMELVVGISTDKAIEI